MNVDIDNISKNNKNWIPICKVIGNSFFAATKYFMGDF